MVMDDHCYVSLCELSLVLDIIYFILQQSLVLLLEIILYINIQFTLSYLLRIKPHDFQSGNRFTPRWKVASFRKL